MRTYRKFLFILSVFLILASCSSAPKKPAEIFTGRNAATGQLDLGNQAVSKGDYANAHLFLQEAWRLSVSTDDPAMRIKIRLAEGNAWFNEGNKEKATKSWKTAQKEAEEAQDKTLISLSKIYIARGNLSDGASAQEVKNIAQAEFDNVKNTPLYAAFAWKVIGLTDKELKNWASAETSIKKAADIHEKGRYLEDAAYDWYLIASIRSKATQYPSAIAALNTAIALDRRAENANGLGMDWMAMGVIHEKAGDTKKAIIAYSRSVEIFESVFLAQNAAEAQQHLETIKK